MSLIDVMVGMVMGLITLVVVMKSFSVFEAQKRTTTNSVESRENGLAAMRAIESDTKMAGFGLVTQGGLVCQQMNAYYNGVITTTPIAPVMITDGGIGLPDSITLTYSTSGTGSILAPLNFPLSNSDNKVQVNTTNASTYNIDQDLYLVATPIPSPGTAVASPCSRLAFVSAQTSANAIYNPPVGTNLFPLGGYLADASFVIDMGQFIQNQYSISGSDLAVTDVRSTARPPSILASDIVSIQAQYGVAPINAGIPNGVTCWTDAIDATSSATDPNCKADWRTNTITLANVMRIKAVRFAVVARSALQEKQNLTTKACDITINPPITWAGGPVVDLTNDPNWACHRYSVYETVVPLKNVIWAGI